MVFGCRGVEQELGESVRPVERKPGTIGNTAKVRARG